MITAGIMLPIAMLLVQLSLNIKWSVGTKAQVVVDEAPKESTRSTLGNLMMAATGLSLLGVSFLLLARSPFRMPVGERLFRVVWLGPPGRAFIRLSSRGVVRRTSGTTVVGVTGPPVSAAVKPPSRSMNGPRTPASGSPDRVAALEARIAALERWRDGTTV